MTFVGSHEPRFCKPPLYYMHHLAFIIIIYRLTTRVTWTPQMISQPISSFFFIFSVLRCPLGLGELQACPFPNVVFLPLPLSDLSFFPFHCALKDGFGQTWWMGDMTIPLQFASLYDGQEVFVWSYCLLDLAQISSLVTWSLCKMCSNLWWHLISVTCILLLSSAVRVLDSQAYRKMDPILL